MKERQDTLQIAQEYSKAHRRKTLWYRAVTCLAAVVVFCTTYALILPAITLEKKCEIPEHTHTDACYTQVTTREKRNPICAVKADVVVHRHDSACYDAEGNLWCTLPEVQAHQHTDACYTVPEVHSHTDACYTQERGECICTESTEPAHRHSDACYGETSVLICGEDHEHGESCYEIQRELICSLTEEPAHTHSDSCYQWNKVLTCSKSTTPGAPELACGKQEVILHTHEPYVSEENPGCYDTDGKTLVCGKTQVVEHQHTAACFETVTESVDTETQTCTNTDPDHVHTALCYGTWELTCGMEEHTHSEECAGSEETVFCGKEVHTHEEACRDENGELVCTLEEHTHSLACYSDPNADVETAEIWKQTFADVELTGDWPQDVIAIAQTQLGYTESTKNYMVAEDGETVKGYTRYGAWYGDPYADWDAMFVSFCLHYAGVDEEFPLKADSASWVQALSDEEYDLYIPALEAEPWPGDLIFFNREPELEEGAEHVADHVGLVTEVIPEEGDSPAQIKVIEGDSSAGDGSPDEVRYVTYDLDDPSILGYAVLPANPGEEAALLSAGGIPDTLYLNIDSIDWGKDDAHIVLAYKSTDNNSEWKFAEMTKESDKIYRIALPGNMDKTNSAFKFVRMDKSGNFSWNNKWNDAPSQNLSLVPNKNCFKLTDWYDGQWEDSWYTPAGGTVTRLYLDLSEFPDWKNDSATFYLKYNIGGDEKSVPLTTQGTEPYYSVDIPADIDTSKPFQFERRNSDGNTEKNHTSNLTLPTDGSDCYVITDWNDSGYWKKAATGETRTIYYDATLSKLSYNGDGGKTNTIPMANGNSEGDKVYCHWSNSTSNNNNVLMTRVGQSDVYRADIPKDADHVLFYSSGDGNVPSDGSNKTEDQVIPDTLESPCFYGDTSDSAIYDNAKRSGYWDEVDTIRNAEAGKNRTVVDIATGTQTKSNDVLYVNTTLYDYYTDYELNGNNRDNYAKDGVSWITHRIYQPFRQFNQALSTYYQQNSASHPLYWGNFQNYEGSHYREISGTLNLYGSDNTQKFFAENNSMWGYDGNNVGNDGKQATQGLVDSTLSGGTLTMGGNAAPFFSESFLSGSNAKNTVLGKVYHNVSFPFVKQGINGVDYWCFDSSQTGMENSNLQLKQDGGRYFLQPTGSGVNGCTTTSSAGPGYFPFNTSSQSGQATQLNYGFGQRFDIQFRLTEHGTVTANNNQTVPVEFNFSGDDDVWVFVDGQLVLDIGGDHGRVGGTINFRDRTSTVSRVKNSGNGTTADVTTDFPGALMGDDFYKSEHTLTMFYMERGLWESNMKITFNFPDENLLEVEKQVDTSSVNSLFQSLFDNKDLFTFNIKTLATHFGTQAASGETSQPVQISLNGSLSTGSSSITFDHTAEHGDVQQGTSEFIRWRCRGVDDNDRSHRFERYGQFKFSPVSLSGQQYLQFDFWYNWNETPSLNRLFVDLRDANGNPLTTEYLSVSSCVSGSPVMEHDKWITLKLDLDRMGVDRSREAAAIRIGYDLGRNVYIRNVSFQPATTVQSSQVGFVTPQNDIPDYGTASTGQLAIPENAVYTSSRGQSYRIGTDGTFTLQNGETVTFHDQFRRGSYMYLEEDTNPLYTTTWSMYEGMNQSPVSTSTVPSGATTVSGGGQNMSNVSGNIVTDGRVEVASPVDGENDISGNKYQTDKISQAPGSTFVFRHYSNPDNTTTTTKLTVKFTNTVKTGSLTIAKAQADGSEDLGTQEFTFYVEFHNVGGMGLEGSSSILAGPYTIPVGGSHIINGIPVGTQFTIHEVKPDGGDIVLDHVNNDIRPGTGTVNDSATYTVTGSIPSDGTAQSYTFYNSRKSVVSLTVRKKWISMQGNEMPQNLPTSIYVQLQRSTNGTTWAPVTGYDKVTLAPGYTTWGEYSYTFRDLDRYASGKTTAYQYRVVELDSEGSVVGEDVTLDLDGRKFTVTYSKVGNTAEVDAPPAYSQTVTNTEQPTGYELPNTGGAGTQLYTMGGCLLTAGAVYLLLYSHRRRRKEDAVSS
ncbi:MAG: LPXTG cell wall anchor domain-containing protein [Candidatus Faecousia sp.]|nr:LPXTG cell wall anchor domain-containing protein [Candidatus Faecousia sp.]